MACIIDYDMLAGGRQGRNIPENSGFSDERPNRNCLWYFCSIFEKRKEEGEKEEI